MKVHKKKPRIFLLVKNRIYLRCRKINLENNENLTITSNNKKNYEICRKDWGYYATPSINERLKKNGLKCFAKQKKNILFCW